MHRLQILAFWNELNAKTARLFRWRPCWRTIHQGKVRVALGSQFESQLAESHRLKTPKNAMPPGDMGWHPRQKLSRSLLAI